MKSDAVLHLSKPPELAALANAWPDLPKPVRLDIVAMLPAAGGTADATDRLASRQRNGKQE